MFAALRERGLFRLVQPEDYSGAELDPPSLIQVTEEIASHDASTAWCVGQTNICALTAAYLAPEVVKDIFGPDTGVLAWGPGPEEAKVVPGGYRVSGEFDFASGSRLASWLGVRCTGNDSYTVTDLFVPEAYTMKRDPVGQAGRSDVV